MEELANNLPAGYALEHYSIREVLGAGSFGITYKAYDNQLQHWVAIKEFLPSDMAGRGANSITVQPRKDATEQFRFGLDRFLEEARTLARFRHPNIVRVSRFIEVNGTAYLVMDYVEGQSLSRYLHYHPNPVSEALLKAWFVPLVQGLVTVHAAGFLHRDIKPGNIYLRDSGEPVLIDFGAARQAIGEQSKSLTGIVSAGYAPTEQYGTDAKKQGPWTDLYAVGATLYRCISGHAPTDAPTRQSALVEGDADPLVPASEKGAGQYSPAFLQLIDELMVLPIKGRPQTAAPVLAALMTGRSEPEPKPKPKPEHYSDEATVLVEPSGRADAETVLVSDPQLFFMPGNPAPPRSTSAKGVDGPPKKGVNLKALGVVGALLILGVLVATLVWVQRNSSDVASRRTAQAEEQLRLAVAAQAEAEAAAETEAQKRAEAEATAQVEAQKRAEAEATAQAEAQKRAEAEATAQAEAQERAEAAATAQAEAEAQLQAEAKAQAEAALQVEAKAKAEAALQAQAKVQADVNAEVEREACAKNPSCVSRVTDAGGGVLRQPAMALDWTQADNGSDSDWSKAESWCKSKRGTWRLPKVSELQSLVDSSGTVSTPCASETCSISPLFNLSGVWFWSSETADTSVAWYVSFEKGLTNMDNANARPDAVNGRALCVRRS